MNTNNHQSETHIKCPECGHSVDVNDVLFKELDADLRKQYESRFAAEQLKLQEQQQSLQDKLSELEKRENQISRSIDTGIEKRIAEERSAISKEERAKAEAFVASTQKSLQEELSEQSEKLKELQGSKAQVLKLQREKDTLKATLEMENEKKLNDLLQKERSAIQQTEAQRNEMKIKEKESVIEGLNKQLSDALKKAEQGSMQTQGEVQELAIEEWLHHEYPQDEIEEVKKRCARGGLRTHCTQ